MSSVNGQGIDKDALYGRFQRTADKQEKLALKLAHKALDIGEDMDIQANQTHHHYGSGTLGKLAIGAALAMGTGGLGLGAWALLREPAETVIEKVIPGTDTETNVLPGEIIVE
jgi:hypothetical protein